MRFQKRQELVGGEWRIGRGGATATEGELAQPFVRIRADNTVAVIVKHLDKGQGTATGLATLVADELDAGPEQIRVEFAPADAERYKNLFFGIQGAGGSTAIANSFQQCRAAGAAARAMLVAAAARAWGVPAAEIAVAKGELSHASGRKGSFGEMAGLAAAESVPEHPRMKTPKEWVFIGKSFPRLDTRMKTIGAPGVYGMDHKAENLLVAVVAHPPKFGARPKTVEGISDMIYAVEGIDIEVHNAKTAVPVLW